MLNKLCALHTERLNSSDRGIGKFKRTTITRSQQPIHQQAASSSRLTRETPESRPSSISSTTKPQALAPGRSQPETVCARSEVSPMKATNSVDHEYMRRHATFPPAAPLGCHVHHAIRLQFVRSLRCPKVRRRTRALAAFSRCPPTRCGQH